VLLPWAAVLLANDKAPRPEHTLRNRTRRPAETVAPPQRALTEGEAPHKVIDAD
jgi:hypothetical protein